MRKISQYLIGFLFVLLIVEMVLVSPSDLKDPKSASNPVAMSATGALSGDVEQIMQGVHVIESKNESKEWELWADSAIGFKMQAELALQKVKAHFFSNSGVSFEVLGETGAVATENQSMRVEGGVVTTSSNGYTFKTSSLKYNSVDRSLSSPSKVQVLGPKDKTGRNLSITAGEMAADLDLGVVLIYNDVKARKTVRVDKKMQVSSDKAQLSGHDSSVRFTGNVIIDLDGVRIIGPDALFKYNSENDQLTSIDLEGGVRVSDFNKWATSEKLSIDLAKNEFVFDGRPRVVQDEDELRGDRIIFIDGGKKVKVQNAKIKVSKESLEQQKVRKQK